jgi:hypothetical protein
MDLKKETKKNNIAEDIIQIYRNEDLIRAFEFDLEKIGNHVINHLPISNIDKLSQVNYYEKLIKEMKAQKIENSGHLKEAIELLNILENLNKSLKISDAAYQKIRDNTLPFIQKNIELSNNKITSEVQICLNGIYGFLLLKLNGKDLDEQNKSAVDAFGDLLSYLSAKHTELKQPTK